MAASLALVRGYPLVLLVSAALISPLPFPLLLLSLFFAWGYARLRPLPYPWGLALDLATYLLVPLGLAPLAGAWGILAALPLLWLVDRDLVTLASYQVPTGFASGWRSTPLLNHLLVAGVVAVAGGLTAGSPALILAGGLLLAYLMGRLGYSLYRLKGPVLECSRAQIRVLAGEEGQAVVCLRAKAGLPLLVELNAAQPWVQVTPGRLVIGHTRLELAITATPPLSGPGLVELRATVMDPWGLVWLGQSLYPVELFVVPRAKYAAWLARRYLEGAVAAPIEVAASPRSWWRGLDYWGSRPYEPGDRLRDVDWKHTLKLGKLVAKEYRGGGGGTVIVLANLVAQDADEADRLGFALISSSLTWAQEGVSTALIAYNRDATVCALPPADPREVVKQSLRLAQRIAVAPVEARVLGPPDVLRLWRSVPSLEATPGAAGLARTLRLEAEALEATAGGHPATLGLGRVLGAAREPALVVVVSLWNHDVEALALAAGKLARHGHSVVNVKLGARD